MEIQSTPVISISKGLSETLWDIPHFNISDLKNWGKYKSNNQISQMKYVIWLLKFRDVLKIFWKGKKLLIMSNFSSYPQYFVTSC